MSGLGLVNQLTMKNTDWLCFWETFQLAYRSYVPYDKCYFCAEVLEALLISKSHTVLDKDLHHKSDLGLPLDIHPGKGMSYGFCAYPCAFSREDECKWMKAHDKDMIIESGREVRRILLNSY